MCNNIHYEMFAKCDNTVVRFGHSVPRVKGGFAIIMEKIIISPNMSEVNSQCVRHESNPHTRKLAI